MGANLLKRLKFGIFDQKRCEIVTPNRKNAWAGLVIRAPDLRRRNAAWISRTEINQGEANSPQEFRQTACGGKKAPVEAERIAVMIPAGSKRGWSASKASRPSTSTAVWDGRQINRDGNDLSAEHWLIAAVA
jgi:hypothetical protein